jgi:hypothetical protein
MATARCCIAADDAEDWEGVVFAAAIAASAGTLGAIRGTIVLTKARNDCAAEPLYAAKFCGIVLVSTASRKDHPSSL